MTLDLLSLLLGLAAGIALMVAYLKLTDGQRRAALDVERRVAAEKLAAVEGAREALANQFKALSADALETSSRRFLETARGDLGRLMQPVAEGLAKVDQQIKEIEKERAGTYGRLAQQLEAMGQDQLRLRQETHNLTRALRTPGIRGRWGELQLQRVVELAGMIEHVDFVTQASVDTEDGRQRPDMVVHLPGGQSIVIDSKVPLDAYLDAVADGIEDGVRDAALDRHARHVREHMRQLGQKAYWQQFDRAPEFVVMFLPDEGFFSAALRREPQLVEAGTANHVLPATPTTLIALLRAVAYGWRQERLAHNARQISDLGQDVYKRLSTFGQHMAKAGRGLDTAVEAYNAAVGSLERQVLPCARKFKDLHAAPAGVEIAELGAVEATVRRLAAPEFVAPERGGEDAPVRAVG